MQSNSKLMYFIYKIISHYLSKNASIWNVDTNFYKTFERLKESLIELPNDFYTNIMHLKKSSLRNKNNNYEYFFEITNGNDKYNITPAIKKEKFVSWGAMRQYLQFLIITDCVNVLEKDIKKGDYLKIELLESFWQIKKNLLDKESIKRILLYSLSSNQKCCLNFGLSLFLYLICLNDEFFKGDKNKYLKSIYLKKIKKEKNINFYQIKNDMNENYKNSYHDIAKIVKNDLIEIINEMVARISLITSEDIYIDNSIEENELRKINFINKSFDEYKFDLIIQSCRAQLRTNLFNSRKLFNESYYTDIEYLDENDNKWYSINWPIDQVEAAHIKSVSKIKKEKFDEFKKENLLNLDYEELYNPNNGLLLPSHYHKAFDLFKFEFDRDGYAILKKEFLKDFEMMNITKFRIKRNVFKGELKNNLLFNQLKK